MESGNPLYQSLLRRSYVVNPAVLCEPPLLPFEKHLIEILGCTEKEYRYFSSEVRKKGAMRPAGYEHIPDIQGNPQALIAAGIAEATATGITLTATGKMFLVQVGIAIAAAGVAYLLREKPTERKASEQKRLGDLNKAGRFSPTHGFESAVGLATYSSPIPVIFGRYRGSGDENGGGILYTPSLVWSQLFSLGTHQAAKLMFVVGEQGHESGTGIIEPDREGIFLGNNPLDVLFESTYAFYWKRNTVKSDKTRIRLSNRFYGTQGSLLVGAPPDARTDRDLYECVTRTKDNDTGFCSSFSPSNNQQFGFYAPIRNGSAIRLNWKHIPIPQTPVPNTDDNPSPYVKGEERFRIAGDKGDKEDPVGYRQNHRSGEKSEDQGMPGLGRNYPCRMGIIWYQATGTTTKLRSTAQVNSSNVIVSSGGTTVQIPVREISGVKKGDLCMFQIRPATEKLLDDLYAKGKVRIHDINSMVDSLREEADEAMQIGAIFSIGQTIWKVKSRSQSMWNDPSKTNGNTLGQDIVLECTEISPKTEENRIGLVNVSMIYPTIDTVKNTRRKSGNKYVPRRTVAGNYYNKNIDLGWGPVDGEGYIGDSPDFGQLPGPGWYPLMKVSQGIVRNSRPCDCTELGIKSTVYQSLNGLCNFQTLFTPVDAAASEKADHKRGRAGLTIISGTTNSIIKRASCFQIWWREAGDSTKTWKVFDIVFVVRGQSTQAAYNFIRIKHPPNTAQREEVTYEFKLMPLSGAQIRKFSNTKKLFLLSAVNEDKLTAPERTHLGTLDNFTILAAGKSITKSRITSNIEFTNGGKESTVGADQGFEMTLTRIADTPGTEGRGKRVNEKGGLEFQQWWWKRIGQSKRTKSATGTAGALSWEIFGDSNKNPTSSSSEIVYSEPKTVVSPSGIGKVIFVGKRVKFPIFPHWTGRTYVYKIIDYIPVGYQGQWRNINDGQWLRYSTNVDQSNNPFRTGNKDNISGTNSNLEQVGIILKVKNKRWEPNTAGIPKGMLYELLGTPTSATEVKESSVQSWSNGTKTLYIKVKGKAVTISKKPASDSAERKIHWSGETYAWDYDSITVQSNTTQTADNTWFVGEEHEFRDENNPGANNPFRKPGSTKIGFKTKVTKYQKGSLATTVMEAARIFEGQSQFTDLSFYEGYVDKSNSGNPEHQVVYVNESLKNSRVENGKPEYDNLTTAGLILETRQDFTVLDQLRVWLKGGMAVERLHPTASGTSPTFNTAYGENYSTTTKYGPSSLLTDLLYHLVTDPVCGIAASMGGTPSQTLATDLKTAAENFVDKTKLAETSKFLVANKLNFDGVIGDPTNFRQFIAEVAPSFLCDFTIVSGKFSITPALPAKANGTLDDGALTPKQYFTSGNILKDSFQVTYLGAEERKDFVASVRYRKERKNQLPVEETEEVALKEGNINLKANEDFDLTGFCTSKLHARLVAKYFLAVRKLITHSISFKTTPYGLLIAPGDLIKVTTETSPFQATRTGSISAAGVITMTEGSMLAASTTPYNVYYWDPSSESDVVEAPMTVGSGNKVSDSKFHNVLFSVIESNASTNMYKVQQITLEEDMTVAITATEFPCDTSNKSTLVKFIKTDNNYTLLN
mgnify:CR=1 FL=1